MLSAVSSKIPTIGTNGHPLFLSWLEREILDEQIPQREGRSNLRVVKKARAKFPSKKPIHKGSGRKTEMRSFSLVISTV
jgi:hypothetical protein